MDREKFSKKFLAGKDKSLVDYIYYSDDSGTIYHGDCLDVMAAMEPNSVDTILTDPPYGLKFMGKEWDHGVPGVQFWKEALRVAKPGTMLLAFGGTRTYHRLTCAIEDAGWQIRDCLMWLYGQGFPKSLDISKAIDKAAGVERELVGFKVDINHAERGDKNISSQERQTNTGHINAMPGGSGRGKLIPYTETAPATPAAQLWDGWGTALKPAWEPIILAMKPLDGTFANNALKHGVAGLHIDGARIESINYTAGGSNNTIAFRGGAKKKQPRCDGSKGRYPANLILDGSDEVIDGFPISDSARASGNPNNPKRGSNHNATSYGQGNDQVTHDYRDKGSTSRFFYCAKASRKERGADNKHPTVKPLKLMEYLCKLTATPTGGIILDPFAGSGTTGIAAKQVNRKFILIEKDVEFCETAKNRLQAED